MKNFFPRLIAMLAVTGALWLALKSIPAVNGLQFDIHGFGWALLIGGAVGCSIVWSFVTGFAKGLVGPTISASPIAQVVGKVFSYLVFAGIFVSAAKYLPEYFSLVNPVGLYWMLGGMGLAFAVYDLIEARFFPRS
jgi:hypothetical protein